MVEERFEKSSYGEDPMLYNDRLRMSWTRTSICILTAVTVIRSITVAMRSGDRHIGLELGADEPFRELDRLLWRPTRTASEVVASTKKIP